MIWCSLALLKLNVSWCTLALFKIECLSRLLTCPAVPSCLVYVCSVVCFCKGWRGSLPRRLLACLCTHPEACLWFSCVKWVTWHCTPPWMPASKQKKNLPDAGKGPAICMHNLHCGTRYLITVLALWLFRCPVRRGAFGGQVRFLGDFGVLVYPPQALPGRAIALRLC